MARKVAVLFIHGIRTGGQGFSHKFQEKLRAALPAELRPHFVPEEVVWSDIVRGKQTYFLNQLKGGGLRPKGALREFVIQGLGDAAAYTKAGSNRTGAYYQIQDRVWGRLLALQSQNDPERPLMIVAHSLGCHIMSSFMWDIRKLRHVPPERRNDQRYEAFRVEFSHLDTGTPLARLETVAGLVTFGNNMPIFAFGYPGSDMFTINLPHNNMPAGFPGERVKDKTLDAARWINIYSRRDPLGYPLGPLCPNYGDDHRIEDIEYSVEGPLSLPFFGMIDAHVKYWNSRFVVKKTAQLLESLITSR